jgi:hypothetical protein
VKVQVLVQDQDNMILLAQQTLFMYRAPQARMVLVAAVVVLQAQT